MGEEGDEGLSLAVFLRIFFCVRRISDDLSVYLNVVHVLYRIGDDDRRCWIHVWNEQSV